MTSIPLSIGLSNMIAEIKKYYKSGFIIPDNDNSGIKASNEIQNIIGDNAEIITPKSELPKGLDIADCFEQWQERVSIMMFDGDVPELDAKQKAREEIEKKHSNILLSCVVVNSL